MSHAHRLAVDRERRAVEMDGVDPAEVAADRTKLQIAEAARVGDLPRQRLVVLVIRDHFADLERAVRSFTFGHGFEERSIDLRNRRRARIGTGWTERALRHRPLE